MKVHYFIPALLILLLFSALKASAIKPVVLTDSLDELCIAREYVEFLEDKSADLTINDILRIDRKDSGFIPSTAQDLVNDHLSSAYWLKFVIENKSEHDEPFRIEMFDFDIDEISFYYPEKGVFIEKKAGFKLPFSAREIGHKNVSFQVPETPTGSSTFYMRFKSKKKNVLEPMIRSYDRTINYALTEYILFGIFYGLLLLVISYNLLYFISLRKSYYFYFVLYCSGVLIYLMSKNGTGFQYLWNNLPQINHHTGETGLFIGTLGMLLFTNSFLVLKEKDGNLYQLLKISIFSRILIYIFQLAYPDYHLFEIIDLIYVQVVFFIAFKLYKLSYQSAKWLLIAYSILNFSFIVTFLEIANIIPSSVLTVYALNAGIILQFVFLSIGIAETVKETYKEKTKAQEDLIIQYQQNEALKEKVNRELEQKVKERTLELDKANEELQKRAEENLKMNVALDLANNELKKYLKAFAQTSVTKEHLDFEEFKKGYPDEFSCIRYLRDLKEKTGFI